jgi:hypothetical protein
MATNSGFERSRVASRMLLPIPPLGCALPMRIKKATRRGDAGRICYLELGESTWRFE